MNPSPTKRSFWHCDVCERSFDHGTFRYNCTVCPDYDQCEECTATMCPPHPHSFALELAFGDGESTTSSGRTMASAIQAAIEIYCDRHCLGVRDLDEDSSEHYANTYSWQTYKAVGDRSISFGHGLRSLIEPRAYVGICASNRPEWVITDFACMLHNFISVPIYCLLNDRDTAFIINNTKIVLIVCDKDTLPKFIRLSSECRSLRHLICMDPVLHTTTGTHENLWNSICSSKSDPLSHPCSTDPCSSLSDLHASSEVSKAKDDLSMHYMGDIEKTGSSKRYNYTTIEPNDILTIIYTSGSSGVPKGAVISDGALRSLFTEALSPVTGEQVSFLYQPLAWYGERNHWIGTFLLGGRAGFSTGHPSRLMEELALVRPTLFGAPPSIWNKIYSEFKSALALTEVTNSQQHAEVEEKLLQDFSKLIPSRCNTIAIVGAMISPIVREFMQRCFRHCQIEDGYGITECGGVAFNNRFDPSVSWRLESIPEMHFTLEDHPYPRGELLTKTPQLFSGYINNLTETRAALTDDGFFRTGDIVELRQTPGEPPYVYIIDRKKNIFKLSNGQFVSPEYLQGIFTRSSFIEQIFVHGDLYEDCVTAVVVPDRRRAQAFAIENDVTSLKSDPKFYQAIMHDLHAIGTNESLPKHEIPARLIIEFEPFTVENGLLTSSLKPCRPALTTLYAQRLKRTNTLEQRLRAMIETATGQPVPINGDASFLVSGGNSLAAVRLSRMIRDDLGITLPLNMLFQPEMNLKRLTEFAQDPSLIQQDSIVSRLLHDAQLDLKVTIGKPRSLVGTPLVVFVTGATGFVGSFLLFEMLNRYPIDCQFICLVRCEQPTNPLDRIIKSMTFLHLWQDHFRTRIVALQGDLAQAQFGLDDKTYASIAAQTEIIFHCGATVNFLLPYSQLYGSNVCGTHEIIRLATQPTHCIPVQYISTISVLSPGIVEEMQIDNLSPHRLTTGYAQSKWVAERLMRNVSRLGLPVVIYRLGSMCASANSGACNPLDLYTLFIAAILKIGSYPIEALNIKLDTLPVSFAAESIVRLSLIRPDIYGNVYHVVHPDGGVAFQDMVTTAKLLGLQIEEVSFEQWRTKIRDSLFESIDVLILELISGEQVTLLANQFYSIVSSLNIPAMDNDYRNKWLEFIMQNVQY